MEGDLSGLQGTGAAGFGPHPHHIATGKKFVQHRRLIVTHASGEYRGLPETSRQRDTLQLLDDTHESIRTLVSLTADRTDALPVDKEHLEGFRFHWPHCLACLVQ